MRGGGGGGWLAGGPSRRHDAIIASKAKAIESLALAFERGEIRVLNDPVLLGELQAFQAERLPSGLLRYSAPAGGWDQAPGAASAKKAPH